MSIFRGWELRPGLRDDRRTDVRQKNHLSDRKRRCEYGKIFGRTD